MAKFDGKMEVELSYSVAEHETHRMVRQCVVQTIEQPLSAEARAAVLAIEVERLSDELGRERARRREAETAFEMADEAFRSQSRAIRALKPEYDWGPLSWTDVARAIGDAPPEPKAEARRRNEELMGMDPPAAEPVLHNHMETGTHDDQF